MNEWSNDDDDEVNEVNDDQVYLRRRGKKGQSDTRIFATHFATNLKKLLASDCDL